MIRGSVEDGLTYAVRRGDGVTIGEDEILAATPTDAELDQLVQTLASRPRAAVVAQLAAAGIQYVVLPAPADGSVAAGLDASGGLDQASAEDRSTRAWQVSRPVDENALDGPTSWSEEVSRNGWPLIGGYIPCECASLDRTRSRLL